MKIRPKINTMTVSFDIGYRVNLYKVARWIGASYEPRKFRALRWHTGGNKVVMLYGTGKGIVVGFKSPKAAGQTLRGLLSYLRISQRNLHLRVVNMQASASIHRRIDLHRLAGAIGVNYLPGIFPNAHYRMRDPRVTVVISGRGGLSFLGAKTDAELRRAADGMGALFEKHKEVFLR